MSRVRIELDGPGALIGDDDDVFLSGRLEQTDLFEICQFLLMGTKTGVLEVDVDGRRGALWFDHGQIVSAVDDALADGEAAAYRIFSWSGGTFTFRVQSPPAMRTIHEGTESLILDIARFMDEHREERARKGTSDDDDRPEQWSHTEGVRKRQEAGEQLRQLFETLRDERGGPAGGDDPLARVWDHARRNGYDAVMLRPGEPALGLSGGQAHPMPDVISDDTVTMAIAALGASADEQGIAQRRRAMAGTFLVSLLQEVDGEALFLQGEHEVLDWQGAGLPADWLEELGGVARGLAWLGAPPAAGRSRAARALAEEMAARGRYTVLLGEDTQGGGGGALSVRQTDAASAAADLRRALHEGASVVVLDLVRGIAPADVAHAAARSLVVACEPTADLRALLGRAAQNARARALFLGALFLSLVGERGHYESLWLPDEVRLGLDSRHPERILGLPEDPSAVCDAGPLDISA
jgi:hypothetical protein